MRRVNAVHDPLDSRFRGNDGVKIENDGVKIGDISAIIASLAPFAPSRLCVKFIVSTRPSAPSFPRKRESRGLKPSSPSEIMHKQQPTDPFSLYGRRLG